jgi:hypothetical protein
MRLLKPILNAVAVVGLALAAPLQLAHAQEVSAFVGFGGAYDVSNGMKIDTFSDGTLYKTPALEGVFAQAGMSVFFGRQWGIGAEISRRVVQGGFAGLNYSLSFASLDAIYRPARFTSKRVEPEYRLGIGDARVHYSFDDPDACSQVPGCPVTTHFQVRFALSERLYLSNHVFLRPALDLHYVNGLSDFGKDWVPEFLIGVGYSLGR